MGEMGDTPQEIERDVRAIGRIDAVPMLLRVVGETTGMGFAAVARVTDGTWTACAVYDKIDFKLQPGQQLDLNTTLCKEVRAAHAPITIDHASHDALYCSHPTPRLYKIESYISVPIVLPDGQYFGNLCAIDPRPAQVSQPHILGMFNSFAQLIGLQLVAERDREVQASALHDERELATLREQFIAVLGHDLRNPLSAVMACAHVLKLQPDNAEQVAKLSERIQRNSRRMAQLIDDTLDLARARLGGGIGIERKPVPDLGRLLQHVVSELSDAHPRQRIDWTIDIAVPAFVCDAGRVQQLVSNLLANAQAHGSAEHPVRLAVRTVAGQLLIEVANQGAPIPPESLSQIFKPFWRPASSAHGQGLGLGLYICAQIVAAHGGELGVESTAEAGTVFTARLPLATKDVITE